MSKNISWQWPSDTDLQQYLNWVKDRLVDELSEHGYLNKDDREHVKESYGLILVKKGIFSKAVDKFFGLEDEQRYTIRLVKLEIDAPTAPKRGQLVVLKEQENKPEK